MMENWNVNETQNRNRSKARKLRITIGTMIGVLGVAILLSQFIPLGQSYLRGMVLEIENQQFVSPVPGAYKREIGDEFAYWDPGQSYFNNLVQQANVIANQGEAFDPSLDTYREIKVDSDYSGRMILNIPAIQISNLNVEANVESYSEDVYNKVLKNGVAHFQGTPLPGAGGNTLIYGHSAVQSYFNNNRNDPETIFTRLEDVKIGDEVTIEKDGVLTRYIVRKKQITSPTDFSILNQRSRKESITLMTCHPVGIPTNRLVVIAEKIDG